VASLAIFLFPVGLHIIILQGNTDNGYDLLWLRKAW
jgi:hypothetical protein